MSKPECRTCRFRDPDIVLPDPRNEPATEPATEAAHESAENAAATRPQEATP